jgi:hypothetical protein
LFFDRVYTFVKAALGGRTRSLGNTVLSLLSFNLFMLMFADDVVIFSPTEEGLRAIFTLFATFCANEGLTIN